MALTSLGRFEEAETRLREAARLVERAGPGLDIYRHALARDHARLCERRGQVSRAIDFYEDAVTEEAKNLGRRLGGVLSLAEISGHRDAIDALSALLRLAADNPEPGLLARVHGALLRSRGRARAERGALRRYIPPDQREVLRERSELSRLVEWGVRLRDAGHEPEDLRTLALRLFQLDAKLALVEADAAGRSGAPIASEAPLCTDEAAIDFAVGVEIEGGRRDVRLYAFLTQGGTTERSFLVWPKAAPILLGIEDLRRLMSRSEETRVVEAEIAAGLKAVAETLWGPIEARLQPGTRRLLLRTDGNLGLTPFAALRAEDGRFICEKWEIVLRQDVAAPSRMPDSSVQQDFFVFGDPAPVVSPLDWASQALCVVLGRRPRVLPTGRLRYARAEAQSIAGLLSAGGTRRGELLLGGRARRRAIIEAAPARIMHFAVHGFSLSGSEQGGTPRERAVIGCPDPDWRAGLVCAGAAAWLSRDGALAGDDDGLLLARDVALLDLEGVDLVTLAACDSSFGETTPGEGLMALADAFIAAGAAAVVAASFELDDASTTEFMQDFYELLLAGRSVEAALREAQASWGGAGRHPRLWAGYNVIGRPGVTISPAR